MSQIALRLLMAFPAYCADFKVSALFITVNCEYKTD